MLGQVSSKIDIQVTLIDQFMIRREVQVSAITEKGIQIIENDFLSKIIFRNCICTVVRPYTR